MEQPSAFNLAPARKALAVELPAPASDRLPRVRMVLAASGATECTLHGVPLNGPVMECLKGLNQVGARLRWEEDGRILCQGGEPVSGYNKSILDKVVHVGDDPFNLYLMLFQMVTRPARLKIIGESGLKFVDLAPIRHFLPLLGAGHRVGKGDTIILESCEYCNSFLNFFPTIAVILDVDADHLDFFKDLLDVEQSFRKFASLVPADGLIVANGDDKNTRDTLAGMQYLSFGFDEKNDVYGKNFSEDFSEFDVFCGGQPYAHLRLGVIGRHNALNALAACAVAWKFSILGETTAAALASFHGAGRRLEYKGSFRGADIYDDYAHHPNELHALLQAVRLMHYRRVICAFQPHTYSRTKALFQDFVDELRTVDQAVLADIYAAREQNTVGISSQDLAAEVPGAVYCPRLQDVTTYLRGIAQPGDIILTVGAGDIYKAGEALLK